MEPRERKALGALRFDAAPTEKTLWGATLAHVNGLNQDVYDRVQSEIRALKSDRVDSPAGLVIHGDRGSGKTHLVWWARQLIAGAVGGYYFNIHPDGDPDTLWTRVVASIVDDLQRPVGIDHSGRSVTQLSLFMRRLAKELSLDATDVTVLDGSRSVDAAEARVHLEALKDGLRQRFPDVRLRNVALALALLSIANDDANVAAVEYLRDSPNEMAVRRDWGLRPAQPVAPADLVDHLSTLLAATGPSLFVVDQIDELVKRSTHSTEQAGHDTTSGDLMAALMTIRERLTRSITLISCLEHTWELVRDRATATAMDRFQTVMQLQPIPSVEVAERFIARFLRYQFSQMSELEFTPPHSTWPVPPEAIESAVRMRPRRVIDLVGEYVRACLAAEKLLPLSSLGSVESADTAVESDPVQDRYLGHRQAVRVDDLKATDAEKQVGAMLTAAGTALLTELGVESRYQIHDAARGADAPSVHCEVVADGTHICLRGINTVNARAVGSRLDNARGFADSVPDTRLVVVRTSPWKLTTRIKSAMADVETSGGLILEMSDDELRTIRAVELMVNSEDAGTIAGWLRRHGPVSKTMLGRTLSGLIGVDMTGRTSDLSGSDDGTAEAALVTAPGVGEAPSSRSVPAEMVATDAIPWGLDGAGRPVTVRLDALSKHVAMFASSGSGKTVLLRRIIEECALRGVSTIVLDPNNDLARLGDEWPSPPTDWWPGDPARANEYHECTDVVVWTPGRLKGNPLTLEPFPDFMAVRDDEDELRLAVDTAVASLAPRARIDGESHTADGRRAVLRESLLEFARGGGGDLDDLIALLGDPPDKVLELPSAAKHADYVATALSYARSNDPLFDGEGTAFDPDRLLSPADGKRARVSVINLSAIPDENRPAFVNRLQMALFSWIKRHPARDRPLSGLFIMDEAQNFIPSNRNTPCSESTRTLASQARKYGLGLVYATQAPRGIDSRIVGNAASHVYGRVTVPAHINAVAEIARNKNEQPPPVSQLTRGRFYVSLEGLPLMEMTAPMCLSHHGSPLEEPEIAERARRNRE